MFSRRTDVERTPNRLTEALTQRRRDGHEVLDLTVSNPTTANFPYAEERILAALANRRALTYAPAPFGLQETRAVIARHYGSRGIEVDPQRIVVTASTSEAYAFLFKLLVDQGDEVLVPEPSYPLFDLLARFEGARLTSYPLLYDGAWHVDEAVLRAAITPKTRAILSVSPNNPTGSYVKASEWIALARTGLPLISDEVFASFPLGGVSTDPRQGRPSVLEVKGAALTFALDGLSKLAALPQMKLAWIVVGGDDERKRSEALARLELIADVFLSASTAVQVAAEGLFEARAVTHVAIVTRLRSNLGTLNALSRGSAVTPLRVEGGWYATLRLPAVESEEAWALGLLVEHGVFVHPGHFFDFSEEPFVVLSLLTPEEAFREGISRLIGHVQRVVTGASSTGARA